MEVKSTSEAIEVVPEFKPKKLSPRTDLTLKCEKVNEVTFKITNGELTNVPTSHGKWAGYRVSKALAWIIKLGADAWVARFGDQICNPAPFNEARSQAFAMARGGNGDYYVPNPISHLNGMQARLLDKDGEVGDA